MTRTFQVYGKINHKKGDFLWRYMDSHKFLDLLLTRNLHFSRLDLLDDRLEAITHEELINRFSEAKLNEHYSSKSFENAINKDYPKSQIEKDKENIKFRQKCYFVNSWFIDSRESVAMWDLYSDRFGVAIKIDPSTICSWLEKSENYEMRTDQIKKLLYGNVAYKNYFDENERKKSSFRMKYVAFRKDQSWQHEREFRLVIFGDREIIDLDGTPIERGLPTSGIDLRIIQPKLLGMTIVFHPMMADWVKRNYRRIIERTDFEGHLKFKDSELKLD